MFSKIFSNLCLFLPIFLISIQSTLTLLCYECKNCTDIASCTCDQLKDIDTKNNYCTLTRESLPNGMNVYIEHVPRNFTRYYVYDPYFISVSETISYDNTTNRWVSESNQITYACQTDKCNGVDLLKQLPSNGLSLSLPTAWLNEKLRRNVDKSTTLCYNCPGDVICADTEYFIDTSKCNITKCRGSCMMTDIFKEAESTEFCYQSFCSDDSSIGPEPTTPQISINAIYYLNSTKFEITEINVFCNAEDCSQLELFKDIKEKLQKDLNGIKPFLPGTHPGNNVNSIYSISFIPLITILFQKFLF